MSEPTRLETTSIEAALDRLAADGLVAFPTETLWGLGAVARSAAAVAALRAWKGRAASQAVSVIVPSAASLEPNGLVASDDAYRLIDAYWPGPLTLVLRSRGGFAPGIANEDGGVGVRCSPHPVAMALAHGTEERGLGPITATSYNRAGEPAAASLAQARAVDASDPGALLVDTGGHDAGGGAPSTVLDLSSGRPCVLRVGALSVEAIAGVLGREVDEGPEAR